MSTTPTNCTQCGTPHTFQANGHPYRCGNCGHSESPPTTDDFLATRADWYAKGCPSDHPYAEQLRVSQSAPRPTFVAPLVRFG